MRTRLAVVQCLMWLLLSASESELHDAAAADESLLDQRRWRGVRWWNVDSSVQWSPRPLSLRRSTERRGSPVPRGVVNSHQMAALGVCLTCQGAVGLRRSHWQVTVDRSTLPAGSYTPRQTRCWPNCSPRPAHTVTLFIITVPHRIIWSWYTGRWWVGCYIWYSQERTGALLAVPNVTAQSSTASVPITVLLYNGPLLCGFNVVIKGQCPMLATDGHAHISVNCRVNVGPVIDNRIYNTRLNTSHHLRRRKCHQFSRDKKWRTRRKTSCYWAEEYATSQLHKRK